MSDLLTKALKRTTTRLRVLERQSLRRYNRLDRKACTDDGLNLEESEQHDFEDGYSSAMSTALRLLATELGAAGIRL